MDKIRITNYKLQFLSVSDVYSCQILSRNVISTLAINHFNLACQVLNTAYFSQIKSIHDKSGSNGILNITDDELRNLLQPKTIENINFIRLKEVISHPYITKEMEWFVTTTNDQKTELAYNFYFNLLTETYEQRNFSEHSGIYNMKSIEKILLSLPNLAKDFRQLIIIKLKKDQFKNFSEIIDLLKVANS